MPGFRYANMGLAVTFSILAIGGYLLRDAGDGPLTALALAAFVIGALVYVLTEARAEGRRGEGNQ